MRLLHGTSSEHLEAIRRDGLVGHLVWVTTCERVAAYWAAEACERSGGEPVVLSVEVDDDMLLPDRQSWLDAPAGVDEERWELWRSTEWPNLEQSLLVTKSACTSGPIRPDRINFERLG
jgi:hypothetical protein